MSTLKVTNIQATGETASRAVSGVAAAWANVNGQGVAAIRDSVNVASLTDSGVGSQRVNYTNAMSSSDYSVSLAATNHIGTDFEMTITLADGNSNASYLPWFTSTASGVVLYDNSHVFCQAFGDLA